MRGSAFTPLSMNISIYRYIYIHTIVVQRAHSLYVHVLGSGKEETRFRLNFAAERPITQSQTPPIRLSKLSLIGDSQNTCFDTSIEFEQCIHRGPDRDH